MQAESEPSSGWPLNIVRLVVVLATMLCTGVSSAAGEAEYPPAPLTPDQIVQQGIDNLTHFLASATQPRAAEIRAFLDQSIAGYFDFPYMSKWAVGPYYRRLTNSQKTSISNHLADTFLMALARNLGTFAHDMPTVQVFPATRGRTSNEVVVPTRVLLDSSFMLQLEFRFYWSPEGWKIFDVAANGSSAVAYYRRYYTEQLRRHGPDAFH